MRILFLGDVTGPAASSKLSKELWNIRGENGIDFAIVNGENASEGNGIDKKTACSLIDGGADVITTGNRVWKKYDIYPFLDDCKNIVRPANYPPDSPGSGYSVIDCCGVRVLVMNVQGTVYMEPLDDPFTAVERILLREEGNYDISVLDVHAEATSEKAAIARYFDGRIDLVCGTHTHVQTADERILPNGSAFITDVGMCGPENSILGVRPELVIRKLKDKMPVRFDFSDGEIVFCGVIAELEKKNSRFFVRKLERVRFFPKN